jgi:multiple sugar transport system ATP-binding protein
MTLGHRIAVLRKGEIQQIGTPRELYRQPANLFVAGFIGSPAINLVPAAIEGDKLVLPMTEVPLPRHFLGIARQGIREVVAGVRPEHFHEASGTGDEGHGAFETGVEVTEWLGSDLFVHFDVPAVDNGRLAGFQREMGLDAGHGDRLRLVARVGSDSPAAAGQEVRLRLRTDEILVFDPQTGERLGTA